MPLTSNRKIKVPPKAMYFNGTDNYVEIPYNSSLTPLSEITLEALINVKEIHDVYQRIIISHSVQNGTNYTIYIDKKTLTKSFSFDVYDPTGVLRQFKTYIVPSLNEWYHFVGVYDGIKQIVYINTNKYVKTWNTQSNIRTLQNNVYIAYYQPFEGYIAFVRIYNRALSDTEIQHNYEYWDNPVKDGLVLWLHWDSVDTDNNLWKDKSGNNNNGTIYGATLEDVVKSMSSNLMLVPPSMVSGIVDYGTELDIFDKFSIEYIGSNVELKISRLTNSGEYVVLRLAPVTDGFKLTVNDTHHFYTYGSMDTNRIYHVVVAVETTANSTTVYVYFDGVLSIVGTIPERLSTSYFDNLRLTGNIGLFRFYKKFLEQDEVSFNYNYYKIAHVTEDLLIYCDSDTIDIESNKWVDKQGYRDGTLQNAYVKQVLKGVSR